MGCEDGTSLTTVIPSRATATVAPVPSVYRDKPRKRRVWSWGFHTVRGGIDSGYHRFRLRPVGFVSVWKGWGWHPIPRGWCCLQETQAISDIQPVGSGYGVSTPCGAVSVQRITLLLPFCQSCRCMEGIQTRGTGLSLLAGAGSTKPSQSAIGRWGWGFHTMPDSINAGDAFFRLQAVGVADGFPNPEWGPATPGCGGIGGFPGIPTLAARATARTPAKH